MYSMKRISRPCSRAESGQRHNFVFGDAADGDGVDLHRIEAGPPRRHDAVDHACPARRAGSASRNRPGSSVSRLMLMRRRPASIKRLGLVGQQEAVGGQADVPDAGDRQQPCGPAWQIAAHQRFAAGQRILSIPSGAAIRTNRVISSKLSSSARSRNVDLFRHAVGAAQVAAIRHADAQVVVRSAIGIFQCGMRNAECGMRRRHC